LTNRDPTVNLATPVDMENVVDMENPKLIGSQHPEEMAEALNAALGR